MSQYTFLDMNIPDCIEKSFTEFLDEKKIKYPNLSNNAMEEWKFEDYLSKNKILPPKLEEECAIIEKIPNISDIKPNECKLIKFFGTIINIFDNQLYISAKYDSETDKYLPNKYYENQSKKMRINNDNLDQPNNINILGDRLRLELIPIDGLNEYFEKKMEKNKKIIVYDYLNKYSKVNVNILVIGCAYEKESEIVIHSWKILENFEKIKICKDFSSVIDFNGKKSFYREKLKNILLKILKNDKIATEYILLFLFSQIFTKVGAKNIGIFPLNLIIRDDDIKNSNDIFANILNFFKKICLKTKDVKLSTDELNNNLFYPRFDSELEELKHGKLQLSDGTFLLVDEINMNEGKLFEIGIKNIGALKSLIDFQLLGYEYPYNLVEIKHDIEILIITHKTKSILNSPFLTLLPVLINKEDPNNNSEILSEEDCKNIFYFINYIRYDSFFNDKFSINDEISKSIQKDYISKNPNFKADDFDLILKLSRFHALSHGRNSITYEDYEYIVYLEKIRKERLEQCVQNKEKK